jgi:hypothetical protein
LECIFRSVFIICRNNCPPCALIISGEGDVNSGEKPNDGNERKVLCLLEKVEVLLGQGMSIGVMDTVMM